MTGCRPASVPGASQGVHMLTPPHTLSSELLEKLMRIGIQAPKEKAVTLEFGASTTLTGG
jgi:hypothetical protein